MVITVISISISTQKIYDMWPFHYISSEKFLELYILVAIPLLFAGITFTLKILNKALTDQSISFMKMMADSKEKEKKS